MLNIEFSRRDELKLTCSGWPHIPAINPAICGGRGMAKQVCGGRLIATIGIYDLVVVVWVGISLAIDLSV